MPLALVAGVVDVWAERRLSVGLVAAIEARLVKTAPDTLTMLRRAS